MKYVFLNFLLFLSLSVSYCQSISNSFINPGYGVIESNIMLNYSIGDIFYGEINSQDLYLTGMIYVLEKEPPTGILNASNPGIGFYPNPCRSDLYIKTDIEGKLTFKLIDLSGIIIRYQSINGSQAVDLSGVPDGVYIISISDDDLKYYYTRKLIKAN